MPVHEPWIDRVECRVARWCRHGLGTGWMLAVSGGGDSVGLLRVLHELSGPLGLRLSVAHLDHGVRGDEARADAAFVAALAGSLGLPFVLGSWRPGRSGHFEADARRARYQWLTEVARVHGASVIAVGHTSDDQAETILHRIIRGTGLRGLAGIPSRRLLSSSPRLTLVRPLLGVSREEVRAYLEALRQPFRDDASNADLSRTRARIRHNLLPKLAAEYNPGVSLALARLGSLAASFDRALEADLRELEKSVVLTRARDCVVLKHGDLRAMPPIQRAEVLRRIWRRAGWPEASMSARRWRRLAALIRKEEISPVEVGARVEVSTDRSLLVLQRRPARRSAVVADDDVRQPIPLTLPGVTAVPWANGAIDARLDPGLETTGDETLDLDQISRPAIVRTAIPGDRFEPLGMEGQSMPLADFFRGRRVARADRGRVPLVCDGRGIIWVVGHRIADRVKVSVETRRTLRLRWSSVPT